MNYHEIIRRPIVTEKSTMLKEDDNTIVFEVNTRANKIQVREAVEHLFKVKVQDVRLFNVAGKMKRMGRFQGKRSDWRKAYVRLKAGEKAPEFFEGV